MGADGLRETKKKNTLLPGGGNFKETEGENVRNGLIARCSEIQNLKTKRVSGKRNSCRFNRNIGGLKKKGQACIGGVRKGGLHL